MSRRTWERRRNRARVASVSTAIFLSTVDRPASAGLETGNSSGAVAPKEARGYPSSQTATTIAADRYESLPVELRLLALGLPISEGLARAA